MYIKEGEGQGQRGLTPRGCSLYGLNGDVGPDRVWFSLYFCLKRGIDFFFRVSLHLNGKGVQWHT